MTARPAGLAASASTPKPCQPPPKHPAPSASPAVKPPPRADWRAVSGRSGELGGAR